MMRSFTVKLISLLFIFFVAGCTSEKDISESIKKVMKEDPTLLADAIKANPVAVMEALQEASQSAKQEMAKKRLEDEKKKFEDSFANPLKPNIRKDESIRGTKGAPLVLVEYSDFECPFCTRGFQTVNALLEKYKGKIQFVYKHLPLSFHRNAMIASQYYEAIRLEDPEKAFEFHDYIFNNQKKLANGEKFLKKAAQAVGADMKNIEKNKSSEAVMKRIEDDQKEAAKFGIQGTPGFLLNGIPVKGAYPPEHFDKIVEKLKEKGMVKL